MTDRRTVIADAAIATLANEGMRGFTHRAVDRRAGLAEGSTSYYFRTREALMAATLARMAELDTLDIGDLPGLSNAAGATDPTSLTNPAGTTGPVGPTNVADAVTSTRQGTPAGTGPVGPTNVADAVTSTRQAAPAGTGAVGPTNVADAVTSTRQGTPAGTGAVGHGGTAEAAGSTEQAGSAGTNQADPAGPDGSTRQDDPTDTNHPAGQEDPAGTGDSTRQGALAGPANTGPEGGSPTGPASSPDDLDALAELLTSLVWRWLTDARERTLARYELTLESTRRPEVRAKLMTHGAAFRVTAEQALTALGAAEPKRRAATLVAHIDGLLLHQLTRVAPSELDRRELHAACRDLLTLALS